MIYNEELSGNLLKCDIDAIKLLLKSHKILKNELDCYKNLNKMNYDIALNNKKVSEQLQQEIDQLNEQNVALKKVLDESKNKIIELTNYLINDNLNYKKQIEYINERNNGYIKQLENQNKIFLEQLTKQHLLDVKPIIVNLKELEE